jgi:hypothetical protein
MVTAAHGSMHAALVATAVVVALFVGAGTLVRGAEAKFTSKTTNGSDAVTSGVVTLTDSGTGAMFTPTLEPILPGESFQRCIKVSYTGNVAAAVRIYASDVTGVPGLGDNLNLTINQGSGTPTAACSGFTPGSDIYGPSTLTTFKNKNSYANGVTAWTTLAGADNRAYRFTLSLPAGTSGTQQGLQAGVTFNWEAQAGA